MEMPEEVRHSMDALIDEIGRSEQVRRYEESRQALASQPELFAKINEFRRKNFEYESNDEPVIGYSHEMHELYRERESLLQNDLAAAFLESELTVCTMLRELILEIAGTVDLGPNLKQEEDPESRD